MDFYDTWLRGSFLAVWGVALLLAYVCCQRLFNMAHVRLYQAGRAPRPRLVWPPVHAQSDAWTSLVGLALAIGAVAASQVTATEMLGAPQWPPLPWRDVVFGLIRSHVALILEIFFLRKIAEHPNFRSNWVALWYLFAVGLAFWG